MTTCPKCHYQRQPTDKRVHPGLCPACGIAYAKYKAPGGTPKTPPRSEARQSLRTALAEHLMLTPAHAEDLGFWWRAVLAGLLALWGGAFIVHGVDWAFIGGSFLHNVNLPFHEFGHVLFYPFGDYMMLLGGSLFQIMVPMICLGVFSFKQQDNFAAAVMLWWCGQNFIDISPYIQDAPYRALPLVGGKGESAHDWWNLLSMSNALGSANTLATTSFALGSVIIILALVWMTALLIKLRRQVGH